MPDPLLHAHRLSFSVAGVELVSSASISVQAGEVVAVLGPNGAGKSTLLSLLAGDTEPTTGQVQSSGVPLSDMDARGLATARAVLPQHIYADVPYTVRAVVAIGRFPYRRSPDNSDERDAAAVDDALRSTDTAHLASRIFATLSGGEQTRVALARVLAQATPLLLLDEPTKALDVGHQEQMLRMIRSRAAMGIGVVIVLHDLNAASAYVDRVVLMSDSRILAVGTPAAVYDETLLSEVYNEPMRVLEHPLRRGPLVLPAGEL